jgi:LysM repeat protein
MRCTLLALATILATSGVSTTAAGFQHVVKHGETLAGLAQQMYGAVQLERILVAANALQGANATPIVPGMLLEIPATSHYRVQEGDSFASIARDLLGADFRATELAEANDSKPWLPPDPGTQLMIPYNLRWVTRDDDTLSGLAYKFLGDRKKAWALDQYNGLKGRNFKPGETLLIPLVDLPLTTHGKQALIAADARQASQAAGSVRAAQRKADQELPALIDEVKSGRYVEAVVHGMELLNGELSRAQLASIHRQLLEAYTALRAKGRAAESCQHWLSSDPTARLDPVLLSPKIIAACQSARAVRSARNQQADQAPSNAPAETSAAPAKGSTSSSAPDQL